MNEFIQFMENYLLLVEQSIDELSDEEANSVNAFVQEAMQFIAESQEQEPIIATPEPLPPIKPGMPSSNVHSFGYDQDNGKLLVKFQGDYPQENGPVYAYGGVPKEIFELFKRGAVPARTDGRNKWGEWWKGKVPSLGASLYTLIKGGNYPYQRVA
jgi:KTSC domain-containing protein